jgi:NAD-dependent DNA ligase
MIGKQQAAHLATRYKTMKRLQLAISSTGNSSSISSSGGSSDPFFDTMAGSSDPFFDTMAGSSLKAWFASSDNKLLLNQLRQAGITCCQEDPTAGSFVPDDQADELALAAAQQTGVSAGLPAGAGQQQPLQGLSICITGIIANPQFANRKEVEDYITKLGGTFKNSLTKSISWLVVSPLLNWQPKVRLRQVLVELAIQQACCARKQCLPVASSLLGSCSMLACE